MQQSLEKYLILGTRDAFLIDDWRRLACFIVGVMFELKRTAHLTIEAQSRQLVLFG